MTVSSPRLPKVAVPMCWMRCASWYIISSGTGAAKAVGMAFPKMLERITCMAFHMPTPDVFVEILTARIVKAVPMSESAAAIQAPC